MRLKTGLCAALFVFGLLFQQGRSSHSRRRRQLFREQVLPLSGGKIPEDAFRSDRLALNRLNKEGIAIPDGVLLEARHRESHFSSHRNDPDINAAIVKLVQRPDGRYIPPEGRYPFNNLVESTYVIRPPINVKGYKGLQPRKPHLTKLQLPAKPSFTSDDPDEARLEGVNLELLNTISEDFPGTRLWTGFGPLIHETADRILRHSGRKGVPQNTVQGAEAARKQQLAQASEAARKQQLAQTEQRKQQLAQATEAARKQQLAQTEQRKQQFAQAEQRKQLAQRKHGQQRRVPPGVEVEVEKAVMELELVDGVVRSRAGTTSRPRLVSRRPQALRPGPDESVLKTHLTAPQPGYPSLVSIPRTSFVCRPGVRAMEADPITSCQVFHLCEGGVKKDSFLCPIGSRYSTKANLCTPWTSVPCPSQHNT